MRRTSGSLSNWLCKLLHCEQGFSWPECWYILCNQIAASVVVPSPQNPHAPQISQQVLLISSSYNFISRKLSKVVNGNLCLKEKEVGSRAGESFTIWKPPVPCVLAITPKISVPVKRHLCFRISPGLSILLCLTLSLKEPYISVKKHCPIWHSSMGKFSSRGPQIYFLFSIPWHFSEHIRERSHLQGLYF